MFCRQIGAKSSATTTLTGLRIEGHIYQSNIILNRSVGRQLIDFFVVGGFVFTQAGENNT